MFNKAGSIIPEKNLQTYKTTPLKQWQGLSDDEIIKTWNRFFVGNTFLGIVFARAIEKAHGIGVDDVHSYGSAE